LSVYKAKLLADANIYNDDDDELWKKINVDEEDYDNWINIYIC
jgi:hypothetical protein